MVILGGVAGTELLPLQVERIEGEGGGGEKGGRRGGQMPRQMGLAASSPGLMNFLPWPSGRSENETNDSIRDDSRTRLINQAWDESCFPGDGGRQARHGESWGVPGALQQPAFG